MVLTFVLSQCFIVKLHTKLPLNGRKPENNSLIRQKNIREIMINHKGTRMAKDIED